MAAKVIDDRSPVRDLFVSVYTESFFDRVHADPARIAEMSFVALGENEEVVGHVGASRGTVDETSVLALVPPSVDSAHRGHGVGQALMHTVLGAAEAAGELLVGVVATPPEWFSQFGFVPGGENSIKPSVGGWEPYFLVRPLTEFDPSLTGTFSFPDAFES